MGTWKQRSASLAWVLFLAAGPAIASQAECVSIRVRPVAEPVAVAPGGEVSENGSSLDRAEMKTDDGAERGRSRKGERRRRAPRFSATELLDLEFEVRFTGAFAGDHLLRLDLRTPLGHHYQSLTAAISTEENRRGASRKVNGYPQPLAVQVTDPNGPSGARRASLTLPVAGTPIVSSSLYGTWTAAAFLDDGETACSTARFELRP